MKLFKRVLLFVFCLPLLPVSVMAAQVEFHPSVALGEEYTDNLFLSDNNPQSDAITTFTPGVILNYKAPYADIALDYSLNYQFYKKHSEQNLDRFVDVQRTHALFTYYFLFNSSEKMKICSLISSKGLK